MNLYTTSFNDNKSKEVISRINESTAWIILIFIATKLHAWSYSSNIPGGHCRGKTSTMGQCDPGGHTVQDSEPTVLYVPGAQGSGAESVATQPNPAGQMMQDVALPTE